MSSRTKGLALALLAAGVVACGNEETEKKQELSQREKDSVLAGSQIPGAKAVGKALRTADSAAARQARIDSSQAP
ncbi:MAG TPA: hypothetical protein VHE82_08980 [Gemmatimonadaceae bacterium]|nr:hypothetical protein [Gemmatimonadaceae bacterium]